jgi:signal transduction histidine kinase
LYQQATREIEERKRAEAALEEERASLAQKVSERTAELTNINIKLSQAMQAKDQFLANMSHELRTPLTAILGKTEVMQEGIYGSLTERQLHAVKTVHSSGTHLLSLINDILDVVRIESGQLELYWEPVALNVVCEAGIQLVNEEARRKAIKINKRFDDHIQTIQGDNKRLTQILVNLLSNAVKFTPVGGEIGLEVYSDQVNDSVKIVVWDTGIGISEAGKQKLFGELNRPKPFAQLENSLARQYQGTGLGLTLVYSLTQMHSGHIEIESEVGKGTQITVSLPVTNENRPSEQTTESTEA